MKFDLHNADCLEVLSKLPDNSIDSIVTDPPYGISFMGAKWDYDTPSQEIWEACLRVLKPGGYLLSFASARTYHRIACRIEDAGFHIRDQILFVYGTGFPKSMDIEKSILKAGGEEETAMQWSGWGTGLKPAHEPIVMARKPFAGTVTGNVLQYGTGALNIDASRIGDGVFGWGGHKGFTTWGAGLDKEEAARPVNGRWPANLAHDGSPEVLALFPNNAGASAPVKGTEPSEVTNGIYGKFANRVEGTFYGAKGNASRFFYCAKPSKTERNEGVTSKALSAGECTNRKEGSAGIENPRAGAGRTSGNANYHPTVKPVALMKWLIAMVTPEGGVTLDCFMGSGTTGKAAMASGFNFIGIERDQGYFEIAYQRIEYEAKKSTPENETIETQLT